VPAYFIPIAFFVNLNADPFQKAIADQWLCFKNAIHARVEIFSKALNIAAYFLKQRSFASSSIYLANRVSRQQSNCWHNQAKTSASRCNTRICMQNTFLVSFRGR
jgi:hypothetical protein